MSAFSCCFFLLTPLGGGILHGVCLESGGNGVGLTLHSTCGVGRHVAAHSPADTPLTCLANVSERVEGGGQNTGHKGHPIALNEGKQGKRASQGAPEPARGQDTEMSKQVANSSNELLMPNCIQKESATELPENCKSSVNSSPEQEKAGERERGRKGSGEKRVKANSLERRPSASLLSCWPVSIFTFPVFFCFVFFSLIFNSFLLLNFCILNFSLSIFFKHLISLLQFVKFTH